MSDHLVKYIPASKARPMGTFVPSSMAYETQHALARVRYERGDIDLFVQRELQYPSVEVLHECFGAEQIDAIALNIWNIAYNNSLIIADATGIGKGRSASGMIRWACVNQKPCVFITKQAKLFTDIYRDLHDIQSDHLVPLIFNSDAQANIRYVPKNVVLEAQDTEGGGDDEESEAFDEYQGLQLLADVKNDKRYRIKSGATLKNMIEGAKTLPKGYDFAMLTYSQISNDYQTQLLNWAISGGKGDEPKFNETFKCDFLRRYAEDAVFVMDEAHDASGKSSNTGYFLREILEQASGICFLSATWAKTPANMGTYAVRNALREANLTQTSIAEVQKNGVTVYSSEYLSYGGLVSAFEKGGVPLAEIMASELAKEGQMIRRQRSTEGIQVDYNYLSEFYRNPDLGDRSHDVLYDRAIECLAKIIKYQKDYLEPHIASAAAEITKGTESGTIDNEDFANKGHNLISQLEFCLKVKEVADEAYKSLEVNEKVVIAFANTMGSFIDELRLQFGDAVDTQTAHFGLVMKKALDSLFKLTVTDPQTDEKEVFWINVNDMSSEAQSAYSTLVDEFQAQLKSIPLSPIDYLINSLESRPRPKGIGGKPSPNVRVRECTGRKKQLRYEDGQIILRPFKADVVQSFADFNAGKVDVLLINRSAATGVSCHASKDFADQRVRTMLIHQIELDINEEMQKRGRINRTGQVVPPKYKYIATSIPSERKRFLVLKTKMRSLDANTSANQNDNKHQLDVVDFFNKYGWDVMRDYLFSRQGEKQVTGVVKDNEEFSPYFRYMQLDADKASKLGAEQGIKKVLNRIALVPCKGQQIFFDQVTNFYIEYTDRLKRENEYDLEVGELIEYDAKIERRGVFTPSTGGRTVFGKESYVDVCTVNNLRKPMRKSQIEEAIQKYSEGRDPSVIRADFIQEFEGDFADYKEERIDRIKSNIEESERLLENEKGRLAKAIDKFHEKQAVAKGKDKEVPKKDLDKDKKRISELHVLIAEREKDFKTARERLATVEADFDSIERDVRKGLAMLHIGMGYKIGETNAILFKMDKQGGYSPSSYVMEFAVASDCVTERINLATFLERAYNPTEKLSVDQRLKIVTDWNENIKSLEAPRIYEGKRFITGNVLKGLGAAGEQIKGAVVKVVKFTNDKKQVVVGVEIPEYRRVKNEKTGEWKTERIELTTVTSATEANNQVAQWQMGAVVDFKKAGSNLVVKVSKNSRDADGFVVKVQVGSAKPYKEIWGSSTIHKCLYVSKAEELSGEKASFKQSEPPLSDYFGYVSEAKFPALMDALAKLDYGYPAKLSMAAVEGDVDTPSVKVEEFELFGRTDDVNLEYFYYELPSAYVAGQFPSTGFLEVDGNEIAYDAPLSLKQRTQYNLVPRFDTPQYEALYEQWEAMEGEGFERILKSIAQKSYSDAIHTLGKHILAHPHVSGANAEFIFGRNAVEKMGKVAFWQHGIVSGAFLETELMKLKLENAR